MILDEVQCPLDDYKGTPRGLHEHFAADHHELVIIDTSGAKWFYEVKCPVCSESYRQAIRGGGVDYDFTSEYGEEIRAVATDILVNHYLGEHVLSDLEESEGESPAAPNEA